MVYFTCNSCGDSVQKPRVAKHISYECKKKFLGVSLCCVDCLKNFDAYTYVDHTKCVSELERYSGNNFVMKASSNKGEKKQGSWIDTVRSVLDQPALTRQQKQFLEAISQFENVPRKKQKFQNFVKSSIRSIRVFPDVVDSVFDLLEKEFKKSAAVTSTPESKGSSEATKDSTIGENPKSDNEKEPDLKKETSDDKSSVNGEQSSPEKKKKKKRKIETQDENGNFDDPENDSKVMKKKKKTVENDNVVLENGEHVPDDDGEISRKKKKKKPKLSNGISCDSVETGATGEIGTEEAAKHNGEDITQKKKKKKRESTIHDENSILCDTMNNYSNTEIENMETEEKMVNGNEEIPQIDGEKISKKKKKRRSKALDDAFCNDGVDDVPTDEKKIKLSNSDNQEECALYNGSNTEETVNSSKKKKKKQKCNEVEVADENEESSNKKTSNKQRENHCDSTNKTDEEQSSLNLENQDSKSVLEIDHEKSTGEPETCGKFDWTDVVTSILSKSSSGELSLKKMEKKVVKEYHNFHGDDMTLEKIVKRLTKKIPKMTTIEVDGGKIRLRGSEL